MLYKCSTVFAFIPTVQDEDSDDEEQRALSENWKFQRKSGRWSRKFVAKDKNNSKDRGPHSPSPSHMVVAELRRSLSELRENSRVQSYDFTESNFTETSPQIEVQPADNRPRSLSASHEDMLGLSKKDRQRGSSLHESDTRSPVFTRPKRPSPSQLYWRKSSEDSSYQSRTASNPSVYTGDSPASGKRALDGTLQASPLVQMSCRSHSMAFVNENNRSSTSSLRSPSPVLVQGTLFSHLNSGSVDSILDEITEEVTVKISKLKNGPSLSRTSPHHPVLLEPPISSEYGSSSLDLSDSLFGDNEGTGEEGNIKRNYLDNTLESISDRLRLEDLEEAQKRLRKPDSGVERYVRSYICTVMSNYPNI